MAAHPRSLGHCFNPISVFWCFDDAGAQAAVVVEVHNTYGDRHAYLVHPDEQGRARTDKAMYVSPVPRRRRLVRRRRAGADRPAARRRHPARPRRRRGRGLRPLQRLADRHPQRRAAPAHARPRPCAAALLIRVHGIWLWARRLPVRPRPTHHQEGVR